VAAPDEPGQSLPRPRPGGGDGGLIYADTGSYQETGRRLGLDRRTVREKVDVRLLNELRGES
jgi:hypothetical protein